MTSRYSLSNFSAPGSLPRRTLVAISHAEAGETRITFFWSAIASRAFGLSAEGDIVAQIRTHVSTRTFTCRSHPRGATPLPAAVRRSAPRAQIQAFPARQDASLQPAG